RFRHGVSKASLYQKSIRRALILIVLGFIYNGFLRFEFGSFRYASVLGQIGLAYLITVVIVLNTRNFAGRMIWLFGILAGYSVIQLVIPVPGCGAGVLTPQCSINSYIDRLLLPGELYGKVFDPEGILCIFSASGITLLGTLAGEILQTDKFTQYRKTIVLAASGIVLILAALILKNYYPVIKSLWTTTFNLLAGGISLVLLAVFYLIIDVWGFRKWTFFFRVIGLNSITIYMATVILDFRGVSDFVFPGFAGLFGSYEPVILIIGLIAIEWLFLYFLFRKKIFLRV
ncbi:MAG: DUF5009 domain-containing protein, partial [Bacteroidales bacterium]